MRVSECVCVCVCECESVRLRDCCLTENFFIISVSVYSYLESHLLFTFK